MTPAHPSSGGERDDASLATAAATGDQAAFAAIYDRYADRLHDFCIGMLRDRDGAADCVQDVFVTAATRLDQLREPDRLRSWLYAIARNEALSRIRDRGREQPTDQLPETMSTAPGLDTLAARSELAELIREAGGGLSDRDRLVLELAYRRDLTGAELAEALGVTARNANTLVERMRDTMQRSLGSLLVCRRVRADLLTCPELATILDDWDGRFTVLMRKRTARHIEGCDVCDDERRRMLSPVALLGSAPVFVPAPAWLREDTLSRTSELIASPTDAASAGGPAHDRSWWPSGDLDTSDLHEPRPMSGPAPAAGGAVRTSTLGGTARRAALGAALAALVLGGAVVLATGDTQRVGPAPGETTESRLVGVTSGGSVGTEPTGPGPTEEKRGSPTGEGPVATSGADPGDTVPPRSSDEVTASGTTPQTTPRTTPQTTPMTTNDSTTFSQPPPRTTSDTTRTTRPTRPLDEVTTTKAPSTKVTLPPGRTTLPSRVGPAVGNCPPGSVCPDGPLS